MQEIFKNINLYSGKIDWEYSSFENSIITFQVDNYVINPESPWTGYIGWITIKKLIQKYPELLQFEENIIVENIEKEIIVENKKNIIENNKIIKQKEEIIYYNEKIELKNIWPKSSLKDIVLMQILFEKLELYSGEIDWNYYSFQKSIIDFQLNNNVIYWNESIWAGYIWPLTMKKLLEMFPELLEKEWFDISSKMKYKTKQNTPLSCEVSATGDILSYLIWKKVEEKDVLSFLDKSDFYNKIAIEKKWKIYWWNPDVWFVWYIDELSNWIKATQWTLTWYWVSEYPISKVIKKYWFETKIISEKNYKENFWEKEHLSLILETLEKWNMVQLWWDICTDPKYYSWKETFCKSWWNNDRKLEWNYIDKEWKEHKYVWLNWEHAFYLLWYKWNIKNPTHIIVWDTYSWKHTYITSEWLRKWEKMSYKSVIVYKK
jgi:hypothetical protein